jgi:hypothetical protein
MAPVTAGGGGGHAMLSQRRAALAGKSGAAGLVQNARTTFIAIFASMGGLVYGLVKSWIAAVVPC